MNFCKTVIAIFKIGFRLGASGSYPHDINNEKLNEIATAHISSFLYENEVLGAKYEQSTEILKNPLFLTESYFEEVEVEE